MFAGPGHGTGMSVVKINAVSVPPDQQARFEERFRGRGGAVEKTPGFEWFEMLRPLEGTDQYLIYTRWSSEEASRGWEAGQAFAGALGGGGDERAPPASDSHHLWSYEVLESTG